MIKDINKILDDIYSLPILECYESILKIAHQIEADLKKENDTQKIELARKVMEKVHGVRYLMSSNKATDRDDFDKKLKDVYQSLNSLIGSE